MSCVHLINTQWPIICCIPLFSHAVSHKKRLISLLRTKPKNINNRKYLHSVHSLSRWLRLRTSLILVILVDEGVGQWRISHSMLILICSLKIAHHILEPSLSCTLCPLLLYFVHLFEIFFSCWVQLRPETVLGGKRSGLTFANLINFEAWAHGWVHHNLSWCLYFLQTIQGDIVEIASTIEISLFVPKYLLEKIISASFSLFLFQQ